MRPKTRWPERDRVVPQVVDALCRGGFQCEVEKRVKTLDGRFWLRVDIAARPKGDRTAVLLIEVKAGDVPNQALRAIGQVTRHGQCWIAHLMKRQALNSHYDMDFRSAPAYDVVRAPELAIALPASPKHRERIAAMCAEAGVHFIDVQPGMPAITWESLMSTKQTITSAPARPVFPTIPLPADPAALDASTLAQLRQVLNVQALASELARLAHQGGASTQTTA